MTSAAPELDFARTLGGPLYALLRRIGIVRPGKRDVARLWRARIEGLEDYGRLAHVQAKLFYEKWSLGPNQESVIGSLDVSSVTDLGTSYEVVDKMRFVPFGLRSVLVVVAATFAPMLPFIALEVPLPKRDAAILHTTLGAIPP